MIEIKNFFEKFLKLHKNSIDVSLNIRSIIFDITKIKLKEGDLDVKENSIYIKCKPIYRNEIFMYKDKIIEGLKKVGIHKTLI